MSSLGALKLVVPTVKFSKLVTRETMGERWMVIVRSALIFGVIESTTPAWTEEIVGLVVTLPLLTVWLTLEMNGMISPIDRTATMLLRTRIFGCESSLTFPCSLRALITISDAPERELSVKEGILAPRPWVNALLAAIVTALCWIREFQTLVQSTPNWFWSVTETSSSCTSKRAWREYSSSSCSTYRATFSSTGAFAVTVILPAIRSRL